LGGPATRDVILSVALFLGPPAAGILIATLREIRVQIRERRASQAEAEALRAEGFPPGPPTHHRPSHTSPE